MPATQNFKLILTGHFSGQNVTLRGLKFTKGVATLSGTMESIQGLVNYFGKTYRAYLAGSDELAAARAFDKENSNGKRDTDGGDTAGGISPDSEVQPDGEGASEETPTEGDGHVDSETGDVDPDPDGTGHENPGVPGPADGGHDAGPLDGALIALANAVKGLDPDVDDNWTALGLPRVEALESLGGGITRKMVNEAVGADWTREKASAKAVEDLA